MLTYENKTSQLEKVMSLFQSCKNGNCIRFDNECEKQFSQEPTKYVFNNTNPETS